MLDDTCLLCGGTRINELFSHNGNPVAGCGECGMRFLRPQPDDHALSKIYSKLYFLGSGGRTEQITRDLKRATAGLYRELLSERLGGRVGKLLEIGCGWGDFLLEAQEAGFDVRGVEYSEDATAIANERLGRKRVRAGTLEAAEFSDESFDVVATFDAIEHVRDPMALLEEVRRILRPGGTLILATPDLDSLSSLLLGRFWPEYKTEHLFYFGRRSMRLALEKSGFERIRTAPNRKILSIEYIHLHFDRFPVPVASPAIRLFRRLCPDFVALRGFKIPCGSLIATAIKPLK